MSSGEMKVNFGVFKDLLEPFFITALYQQQQQEVTVG